MSNIFIVLGLLLATILALAIALGFALIITSFITSLFKLEKLKGNNGHILQGFILGVLTTLILFWLYFGLQDELPVDLGTFLY